MFEEAAEYVSHTQTEDKEATGGYERKHGHVKNSYYPKITGLLISGGLVCRHPNSLPSSLLNVYLSSRGGVAMVLPYCR